MNLRKHLYYTLSSIIQSSSSSIIKHKQKPNSKQSVNNLNYKIYIKLSSNIKNKLKLRTKKNMNLNYNKTKTENLT